jgi:hypothetical protein
VVCSSNLCSLRDRRASLLGVAIPDGAPISQAAIERLTSVSARSQRRYAKTGAFVPVPQVANVEDLVPGVSAPARRVLRTRIAHSRANEGMFVCGDELMKRLPHRYEPVGPRAHPGQRSKDIFRAQPHDKSADGKRTVSRRYFDSVRQLRRRRRQGASQPDSSGSPSIPAICYVRDRRKERWTAVHL